MECRWCRNSRKNSRSGVICQLFGITIHAAHQGCKYFKDATAAEKG